MKVTREMLEEAGIDPSRIDDPDFMRVIEDALDIQNRFVAEPVFARTGKGYLKSVGVAEIKAAKKLETSNSLK
jgi:hypothetical protein